MSDPKGVIDPRSTFEIRQIAMQLAISVQPTANLIETAIEIEAYLLGDNSRILQAETPEQPSQSLPPESEVDAMAEKLTKMQEESSDEPQWMKNDRERDTMVGNGLHNMSKPLGYGEVAVACDDPASSE